MLEKKAQITFKYLKLMYFINIIRRGSHWSEKNIPKWGQRYQCKWTFVPPSPLPTKTIPGDHRRVVYKIYQCPAHLICVDLYKREAAKAAAWLGNNNNMGYFSHCNSTPILKAGDINGGGASA